MSARALKRRYGHAPLPGTRIDKALHAAPWVERFHTGPERDLCLYEILKAALGARGTAEDAKAQDTRAFKSAETAIDKIARGEVPKAGRCKAASAALRKYVQAYGGSKAEAEVLAP